MPSEETAGAGSRAFGRAPGVPSAANRSGQAIRHAYRPTPSRRHHRRRRAGFAGRASSTGRARRYRRPTRTPPGDRRSVGAAAGTLYLGKVYFRIPGAVRPKAFVVFLLIAGVALMSVPLASRSLILMFLLLIVIGITLGGAYTTLLGEVAASIGGRANVASTTSVIDGVGSVAGILAGRGIAELVSAFGWMSVWSGLGALCLLAAFGWMIVERSESSRLIASS